MKATIYSNLFENLLEKLKKKLFFDFLNFKHFIFVPNKLMKNWLMKSFCDDNSIKVSFNVKFINFSNFLNFIQNELSFPKEKRFLNFLELNLIINKKIYSYITKDNFKYANLKNYLMKNNKILEKRLLKICDELTNSFLNYTIFGNFQDLNKKKEKFWQASLFHDIFYVDNYSLPFRDLKDLNIKGIENNYFHFFSINYIPSLYFDFLDKYSNVFHYINSPCKFYWEDIVSDYERHSLKKYLIKDKKNFQRIDELDSYLKERNNFLANMEKLKRKYLSIISNYDDYYFFESFYENQKKTILSIFQNDILNLENRNPNNYAIIKKIDSSFQIHVVNNKFREIQVLHSNILNILFENENLNLSDIHVIAPDINEYAPYIHMIFNDKQNPLNYKIADFSFTNSSNLISGIDNFFSLAKSRWEKFDIMNLLENPLFQKKNEISNDDLILLFELIEKANISFGIKKEHFSNLIKNEMQLEAFSQKSFNKGLARILNGMVYLLKDDFTNSFFPYDFPVDQLEMSNCSVLIDKFIKIIFSISKDLEIIEENKSLSLKEWRLYFKKIIKEYFLLDDSFIEKSVFNVFFNFLQDIKKIEFRFEKNKYFFETIYDLFKKYIGRSKINFNLNNEQAIYFSSFNISALPAKAIFIIGLDSEALKFYTKNSIDISNSIDMPDENDLKRSLFLEAILSAREFLILSYYSTNNYKIDSCIVLQELIYYLDNSYKISDKKPSECLIKKHLDVSFDKEYFADNTINFSKIDFLAAQSFYNTENKKIKDKEFGYVIEIPDVIDINNLRLLCKNPIKFYLNKGLEIYFKEEKKENEFNFSTLNKYIINQATFKYDIEDVLLTYEKKANVPLGIYYQIEKDKILSENENFLKNLSFLGIDKSEFITIEFNLNIKKVNQLEKNYFQFPAIELKTKNKNIKLIGTLQNVTKKGLLITSDDKLTNKVRAWVDILIYHYLDNFFSKQVIFFKSLKIRSFQIDDINKYLTNYLEYYFISLNEPSFMIKPLIEHILQKDQKSLSKAINRIYEEKKLPLDIYTKWFLMHYKKPEAKQIIDKWSDFVHLLFKPILEEI